MLSSFSLGKVLLDSGCPCLKYLMKWTRIKSQSAVKNVNFKGCHIIIHAREILLVPRMEAPRRKTATVAIKEPMKLGNLVHIRSIVLLYFSIHVTAIGSAVLAISYCFRRKADTFQRQNNKRARLLFGKWKKRDGSVSSRQPLNNASGVKGLLGIFIHTKRA